MLSYMFAATNFEIKKATHDEISDILLIAKATWEPTYREILTKAQINYMYDEIYTPTALEKQMQELGHVFLVLYSSGKPVGYVSYSQKPEGEQAFKIHKLYVHPAYQGKNMGRTLVSAVEKELKEVGAAIVELNVNRYNPAVRFYERCGYQQAREEDIPMGEFWMNDFVMYKQIK